MSPTPTQGTTRPWPFGTGRPSLTPCTNSLLAGPMVSGIGLRNLWSRRRHLSPFPPSSGPSPPCSPCSPISSDLPKDPCPTHSKPRVPMLGYRRAGPGGGAGGPPSPQFLSLCCIAFRDRLLLLLGELGHCGGASAAAQTGVGLGRGEELGCTASALGTEGQDGPVVQCVGCAWSGFALGLN